MKKIRQHNDIDISVVIKNTEGEILDPSLCKGIQIRVQTNGNETQIAHYDIFEDGHIVFRFNAKDQTQIGVYDIVISATTTDGRVFTTDVCKAFCIVPCTCCTDNEPGEVEIETLEVEATIEITSWGYMYDKRVEAIEDKLERLDNRDDKLQEQIDSNHTELGEAFEGLYDDMEKNYSKKSNTIRHFSLFPIATANGLSLLLEGEYDDSVQGSHLLGPHNIILPYATESKAGIMSPEDKKAIAKAAESVNVSALFTVGGSMEGTLATLALNYLTANGATVRCMPIADGNSQNKVVLERQIITYYGSGLTARRDCAIVTASNGKLTTSEVRIKNYELP